MALDTGMGRIGFQESDGLNQAAELLINDPRFVFEGVFTHFATADEKDPTYFNLQVDRFHKLVDTLPEKPRYVHVSNTATSLWHGMKSGCAIRRRSCSPMVWFRRCIYTLCNESVKRIPFGIFKSVS